ncbi:hypothetical protein [Aquimarina aquimarini]|uniref:hypothetical protein n=1 Tax=Aquimarina aquimarini TaxID=1191734 RepID=UPI000D54E44A|nr:hypothetical protein [Aquimarina aquimarini]
MALDFHRLDNNEYLFGLDDHIYTHLEVIFTEYKHQTGIFVDPYGDTELTVDKQKIILKIIDTYINTTDLNVNKEKTIEIMWFRALISYFSDKEIIIKILGD